MRWILDKRPAHLARRIAGPEFTLEYYQLCPLVALAKNRIGPSVKPKSIFSIRPAIVPALIICLALSRHPSKTRAFIPSSVRAKGSETWAFDFPDSLFAFSSEGRSIPSTASLVTCAIALRRLSGCRQRYQESQDRQGLRHTMSPAMKPHSCHKLVQGANEATAVRS